MINTQVESAKKISTICQKAIEILQKEEKDYDYTNQKKSKKEMRAIMKKIESDIKILKEYIVLLETEYKTLCARRNCEKKYFDEFIECLIKEGMKEEFEDDLNLIIYLRNCPEKDFENYLYGIEQFNIESGDTLIILYGYLAQYSKQYGIKSFLLTKKGRRKIKEIK